jgi:hypothetical protein
VLTDVSVTALPLLWLLQFSLDHDWKFFEVKS